MNLAGALSLLCIVAGTVLVWQNELDVGIALLVAGGIGTGVAVKNARRRKAAPPK